jgi:hypothetical protein
MITTGIACPPEKAKLVWVKLGLEFDLLMMGRQLIRELSVWNLVDVCWVWMLTALMKDIVTE